MTTLTGKQDNVGEQMRFAQETAKTERIQLAMLSSLFSWYFTYFWLRMQHFKNLLIYKFIG